MHSPLATSCIVRMTPTYNERKKLQRNKDMFTLPGPNHKGLVLILCLDRSTYGTKSTKKKFANVL